MVIVLNQSNEFSVNNSSFPGTALPAIMRQKMHLRGQIPSVVDSFENQAARALKIVRSRQTQLEKYTFMAQLRNNNTRLFYKLLNDHIEVILGTFKKATKINLKITINRNLLLLFIHQLLVKHVKNTLIFTPF